MKSLGFVSSCAILLIALAAVLSDPVAHANHPGALSDAQKLSAGLAVQPAAVLQSLAVSFAKAVIYNSAGYYGDSVAIGDVNGDGHPDLIIANECQGPHNCSDGGVSILLANGDGTFQAPVSYSSGGQYASSVAIGDVNGDGHPDVIVANGCPRDSECSNGVSGVVSVLLGNGDGTFQAPVSYSSGGFEAISVAIGDVNGDSHPDLVVANLCPSSSNCAYGNGEVSVLLSNGDGTFQAPVSYILGSNAVSVAIGDLNSDGRLDLLVTIGAQCNTCTNSGVSVLLGNGDGTFQAPVTYSSGGVRADSVAIKDVNGDGHPDLVVANECLNANNCNNGSVSVLLGNGDGTFQAPVSYSSGGRLAQSVAIGDVNGDGYPDLVVANACRALCSHGSVSVLLGNGDGTFEVSVSYGSLGGETSSVAIADVNADGKPDLLLANGCVSYHNCANGTVSVLLNNFTAATTTTVTSSPNPSHVNQQVTCTATVTSSSSVPNGSTVTFYVGTTKLGTSTTTNGVATLTTSFSKPNTYTVKAKYAGDIFHKPSYGTVTQVVNP